MGVFDCSDSDEDLDEAVTNKLIEAELHAFEDPAFRARLAHTWIETCGPFDEHADLFVLFHWIAYQLEES